jgi:predicted MFS family arabinose efflux permease
MPHAALLSALGIAQIVSWGTLFYAIGVLGTPMRAELGVSELHLFGAFAAGLLAAGTLAPVAGRAIDRHGGRRVLATGSALGGAASLLLAVAPDGAVMTLGWLVAGAAMSACLYDPAFATLSQHLGERYRRGVTVLTLWGGFASTVFWPLSQLLLEAFGWRATWLLYAALHLGVCLPIHLLMVPVRARDAASQVPDRESGQAALAVTPALRGLALAFAIATFVFGVIAVHLVNLLTSAGLTAREAVVIAMLVGPMQVAGRVAELLFARRVRAVRVGIVAFALMLIALLALWRVHGAGLAALVFVVAYGWGNGLITIVKGTAPAELFGRETLGALLGYLARASQYAKAVAPAAYPALLALGLARLDALGALGVLAAVGWALYALSVRAAQRQGAPTPMAGPGARV